MGKCGVKCLMLMSRVRVFVLNCVLTFCCVEGQFLISLKNELMIFLRKFWRNISGYQIFLLNLLQKKKRVRESFWLLKIHNSQSGWWWTWIYRSSKSWIQQPQNHKTTTTWHPLKVEQHCTLQHPEHNKLKQNIYKVFIRKILHLVHRIKKKMPTQQSTKFLHLRSQQRQYHCNPWK